MNKSDFFEKINNKCIICDGNFVLASDTDQSKHFWCGKCQYMNVCFNKLNELTYYRVMNVDGGISIELIKTKDDDFYVRIDVGKMSPIILRTKNPETWVRLEKELIEKINSLLVLK